MTIYENVPQDTIRYDLTFETGLTLDSVRMQVLVNYTPLGQEGADESMSKIRSALKSFVSTDWNFNEIRRVTGKDNIERISLTATARVKAGEDANIKNRIDSINTRGLTLSEPSVDYSFPLGYLNENRAKLRLQLIKAANDEARRVNEALGGPDHGGRFYRVHEVRFGHTDDEEYSGRRDIRLSASNSSSSYGQTRSVVRDAGETIHSEKMFLTAEITIAAVVAIPASNGKKEK